MSGDAARGRPFLIDDQAQGGGQDSLRRFKPKCGGRLVGMVSALDLLRALPELAATRHGF